MKHTIAMLATLAVCASTLRAQARVFTGTVWPKRIAVGMRSGNQLGPLAVEATNTGWVTVTFLSTRPDEGLAPPPMRMITSAHDVLQWTARVRKFIDELDNAIGAQFIVDTTGRIERGSMQFLPGSDPADVRAARAALAAWRFIPAEIDGTPVRQRVQMPVWFAQDPAAPPGGHAYSVSATANGWVHLVHNWAGRYPLQEWFEPDSVDAWVARVRELNALGQSLPRDTEMVMERMTVVGPRTGIRFAAGFFRHGKALEMRAALSGCGNAFNEGEQPVGDAGAFLRAAREARAHKSTPADSPLTIYAANEVACPAWMIWSRSNRHGFEQVWQYQTGQCPASIRSTNAHADVLVSFVVDTAGTPELSTLSVMPGSDPRAVAALPGTLGVLQFRPATRAGRKVRQRVVQTIRFEPPPECASPDAGPACPRRYSDR